MGQYLTGRNLARDASFVYDLSIMKKAALLLVALVACGASAHAISADSLEYGIVTLRLEYMVSFYGPAGSANLIVKLPSTIQGRQQILRTSCSIEPFAVFMRDGERYARFMIQRDPAQDDRATLDIVITARLLNQYGPLPGSIDGRYFDKEPYIECYDEGIQRTARGFMATKPLGVAYEAYGYVRAALRYDLQAGLRSAREALDAGVGDCSEFAEVFVALMRARRCPARFIYGIALGSVPTFHDTAEVLTRDWGWIRVEPIAVDPDGFLPIYNEFVVFSLKRMDGILDASEFYRLVNRLDSWQFVDASIEYLQ